MGTECVEMDVQERFLDDVKLKCHVTNFIKFLKRTMFMCTFSPLNASRWV